MSYDSVASAIPSMTYDEQINLLSILIDAVKKGIHSIPEKKSEAKDHRDSYPEGYFDLFGSCDDDSFVEPEELSWELEKKKEQLTY